MEAHLRWAASASNVLTEEVVPRTSLQEATGQVFEPDRPHKSLHVLGRRLKTKALVTGLKAATEPDMPSKPACGRELAGGFDSRPPPLMRCALTSSSAPGSAGGSTARPRPECDRTSTTTQVFRCSPRSVPHKSSDRPHRAPDKSSVFPSEGG